MKSVEIPEPMPLVIEEVRGKRYFRAGIHGIIYLGDALFVQGEMDETERSKVQVYCRRVKRHTFGHFNICSKFYYTQFV